MAWARDVKVPTRPACISDFNALHARDHDIRHPLKSWPRLATPYQILEKALFSGVGGSLARYRSMALDCASFLPSTCCCLCEGQWASRDMENMNGMNGIFFQRSLQYPSRERLTEKP